MHFGTCDIERERERERERELSMHLGMCDLL
jgi:hypothetical protein